MVEDLSQINQAQNVDQIDATQDSDVAGGAAVEPAYIPSSEDIINTEIGVSSVDTSTVSSNSVSGADPSTATASPIDDSDSNYVENTILDSPSVDYSDSDLEKILTIADYVDPFDPAVQDLLSYLKEQGIISEGMTPDEIALQIYNYVVNNFEYISDLSLDTWAPVSYTIEQGGGDCEDLSFLLSSLLIAALVDSGMSLAQANEKVMGVAVNLDSGEGHIFVLFKTDDGSEVVLDPTQSDATLNSLDSAPEADLSSDAVLFTFTDSSVDVVQEDYDYSAFESSAIVILPQESPAWNELLMTVLLPLEEQLEMFIDDFYPQDYYYNSNGFWVMDSTAVEPVVTKAMAASCILTCIAMMSEERIAERQTVLQHLADIEPTFKDSKTVENTSKTLNLKLSMVQGLFAELFERVQTHNYDHYQMLLEMAKRDYEDDKDRAEDSWSTDDDADAAEDYLEDCEKYSRQYESANAAMIDSMGAVYGGIGGDLSSGNIFDVMDALAASIMQASLGTVANAGNGYQSFLASDNTQLRNELNMLANAMRLVYMVMLSKQDERNIIEESITGKVGWTGSRDAVTGLVESKISHMFELFDRTSLLLSQKVQLHNTIQDIQHELDKLAESRELGFWADVAAIAGNALAFIVGIAVTIMTGNPVFGGLAAGGISALANTIAAYLRYEATKAADAVVDEYEPVTSNNNTMNVDLNPEAQNPYANAMGQAEAAENSIVNQANKSALKGIADGYLALDYAYLAELQARLQKIQNLMRVIFELSQFDHNVRRTMMMLLSGSGAANRGYGEIVQASLNAHFTQMQASLQAKVFELNEIKTAHNMERADEIAMQNATRTFWASIATAIIGSIIGAFIGMVAGPIGIASGALAGWGMGMTLGQSGAELYNAKYAPGSSYGVDFSSNSTYFAQQAQQTSANNSNLNAQLEMLENQVYEQMMNNGIASAGGGYSGLDVNLLIQLRKLLQMIANIKEILAALRKSKAQDRAIARETISGAPSEVIDVETDVIRGEYQSAMQVFQLLTQLLQEQIEVENRANDAEKAAKQAEENLTLNLVIATVMTVTSFFLPASWGNIMRGMTSSIMSLATLINNILHSKQESESGMGDYEHYNPAQQITDSMTTYDPDSVWNQLKDLENQIYTDITPSLIEDLGKGMWGINTGYASYYQNEVEAINRLRKIIAMLIESRQAERASVVRNMAGLSANQQVDIVQQSIANAEQAALEMVSLIFEGLQIITQRHNQMTEAQRQMWIQLAQLAIQAILTIAQYSMSKLSEVDMKKAVENNNATEIRNITKQLALWKGVELSLDMFKLFSNQIVGDVFDLIQDRNRRSSRQPSGLDSNKGSSPNTGLGAMDAMNAQTVSSRVSAGEHQLNMQDIEFDIRRIEEQRQNFVNAMMALPDLSQAIMEFLAEVAQLRSPSVSLARGSTAQMTIAQQIKQVEAKIELTKQTIGRINEEIAVLKAHEQNLQIELQAAEQKYSQKMEEVAMLERQINGMEESDPKRAELIAQRDGLIEEARGLKAEAESKQTELNQTRYMIKDKTDQVTNLQQHELPALQNQLTELRKTQAQQQGKGENVAGAEQNNGDNKSKGTNKSGSKNTGKVRSDAEADDPDAVDNKKDESFLNRVLNVFRPSKRADERRGQQDVGAHGAPKDRTGQQNNNASQAGQGNAQSGGSAQAGGAAAAAPPQGDFATMPVDLGQLDVPKPDTRVLLARLESLLQIVTQMETSLLANSGTAESALISIKGEENPTIKELESALQALKSKVDLLYKDIKDARNRIEALKQELNGLKVRADELAKEIAALEETYKKKKKEMGAKQREEMEKKIRLKKMELNGIHARMNDIDKEIGGLEAKINNEWKPKIRELVSQISALVQKIDEEKKKQTKRVSFNTNGSKYDEAAQKRFVLSQNRKKVNVSTSA